MIKKLLFSLSICAATMNYAQSTSLKVGQAFNIDYPTTFVKTYDLNDSASLQMTNAALGKFSIIIQDEKSSLDHYKVKFGNLEEALNFYSKNLVAQMEDGSVKIKNPKNIIINNYKAAEMEIEGSLIDDETYELSKIFYHFTIIETPNYYYQILSWTNQEHKAKFLNEFQKIATTFKEVN